MSLEIVNNRFVHFPKNAERFEFDGEVAQLFDDMARRSIPMYAAVHNLHAGLLQHRFPSPTKETPLRVYDIGASRGGFLRTLCMTYGISPATGSRRFDFIAVDSSRPMLDLMSHELPWVTTLCVDALSLCDLSHKAHCISLLYILQFIKEDSDKLKLLQWAERNLIPGGLLLLGQKEVVTDSFSAGFDSLYYQFRKSNGYSDEEILRKTAALKNSMWPIRPEWLEDQCYRAGFIDFVYTTRWLMFSSAMCLKKGEDRG